MAHQHSPRGARRLFEPQRSRLRAVLRQHWLEAAVIVADVAMVAVLIIAETCPMVLSALVWPAACPPAGPSGAGVVEVWS